MESFNIIIVRGYTKTLDITYVKNGKQIFKRRYKNKQIETVVYDAKKVKVEKDFTNVEVVLLNESRLVREAIEKIKKAGINIILLRKI